MLTIANNIRSQMTKKGLSAHSLEKTAGLRNSAVQNILYGRSKNPSIKILTAIAEALDCEISDLISTPTTTDSITPGDINTIDDDTSTPWNQDLYFSSQDLVKKSLSKFPSPITKEKYLALVDEVYNYSLKQNSQEPDEFFTAWLIERGI